MTEISVPTSLRYTFKRNFDWFPVLEGSKTNYLISGLLYNDSILVENLEAEPFPFLEDYSICQELVRTKYFLKGNELTILRRIEDFVASDFEPQVTKYPCGCVPKPATDELQKQFAYLDQQVKEFKPLIFQSWISAHNKHLFNHQDELKVDHSRVVQRLYNQIELETKRYLTLNKYHIIREVAIQFGYWNNPSYCFHLYHSVRTVAPSVSG